jgi:hypothetical protein
MFLFFARGFDGIVGTPLNGVVISRANKSVLFYREKIGSGECSLPR